MIRVVKIYGNQPSKAAPATIRLGDIVERLAKPIAKALRMPCLEASGGLKPESECAKRRDALNNLLTGRPKNP